MKTASLSQLMQSVESSSEAFRMCHFRIQLGGLLCEYLPTNIFLAPQKLADHTNIWAEYISLHAFVLCLEDFNFITENSNMQPPTYLPTA